MDGHLFRLSGTTAELRGGKFTHYAVDQFRHWKPCKLSGHGQVVVSVKLCDTTYSTLNLASPGVGRTVRLHVEACPDSGAMMVMCGPRQVEDMCFSTSDLLLPNTDIKTVDGTTAKVLEGLFVEISGYDKHREEVLSKQLMYCMEGVDNIYLSRSAASSLAYWTLTFRALGEPGEGRSRLRQPRPRWAPVRSRGWMEI